MPEVSSFKREDLPKLRRGFADIDHKMLMDEASTLKFSKTRTINDMQNRNFEKSKTTQLKKKKTYIRERLLELGFGEGFTASYLYQIKKTRRILTSE